MSYYSEDVCDHNLPLDVHCDACEASGVSAPSAPLTTLVYALRNKHTGLYLPDRQGKGYTNDEPTSKARPRLHWSRRAAEMALRAWLKSVWTRRTEGGYRYDHAMEVECDEWTEVRRVETRRADDMEIVEFKLTEEA